MYCQNSVLSLAIFLWNMVCKEQVSFFHNMGPIVSGHNSGVGLFFLFKKII